MTRPSSIRRAALAALGALGAAAALAAPVQADDDHFGFSAFEVKAVNVAGGVETPVTQAGSHPGQFVTDFTLTTRRNANGGLIPFQNLRDVEVQLPTGLVGDPFATPRCSMVDYGRGDCSTQSIVGSIEFTWNNNGRATSRTELVPVYNVVPPAGTVARLAFPVNTVDHVIDMEVNDDGRYNLVARIRNISQGVAMFRSRLTLFGVPADLNGPGPLTAGSVSFGGPSGSPRVPFLTLGPECGVEQAVTIRGASWADPHTWVEASSPQPALTGCDKTTFAADLAAVPESQRAGVPSGYEMRLGVPQARGADAIATPAVRRVVTTLPAGVAVSPSSASGLVGCSDAQAGLGMLADPACPDASRIGSVSIDTPVLDEPLTGGVFLGQPKSMRAAGGEMLRLLLIAQAQGVTIKQEGRITPDPVTGQLRAVFDAIPQLPFSRLTLRLDGGPSAPLTNPRTCGTYTTATEISSWSGQTSASQSSFAITQDAAGGPCAPLGFAPSFVAGMGSAAAGSSSALQLAFGRTDGEQDLGDLTAQLPAGLMGMVSQAELCDDAAAAAGTCGAASRIGGVTVASGAGSNPLQLTGRGVYLTGPYKGAPFGLSIVVPAIAGPFDLGTVAVRAAIHVDRKTAALTIVSDPFPTILEGIPLRMRQVTVSIDKPGFMVNPTSCSPKSIGGLLRSAEGATATVGARFQVGGCRDLPYAPRLGLKVGARGRTKQGITTPLSATLRMTAGQANNRGVTVKLPRQLNSRLDVIRDACTLEQFEAERCDKAPVGTAVAVSPVLRNPLRGSLQFVRNPARRLPDLMVRLKGSGAEAGVAIDLTGKVTIPRDLSLQTSFDTIPDVPISMFRLDLVAGRRGAIGTTENLCRAQARRSALARVDFRAQSGALRQKRQRVTVTGCAGVRAAAKR